MNDIRINTTGGEYTVSSMEIAEHFGKKHKHVIEAIKKLMARNSAVTSVENSTNLFIPSNYVDSYGRVQNCYEVTRDGFTLLVMGFNGQTAFEWKIKYIEAFNKMEKHIKAQDNTIHCLEAQAKADKAAAMRLNAENKRLKMLLDNPAWKDLNLSDIGIHTLAIKAAEVATGQDLGNHLPRYEQTYTASEIAKEIGTSAAAVGRKANELGIKNEEHGIFVLDKSKYSSKEVTSFRYNGKGHDALLKAFDKS